MSLEKTLETSEGTVLRVTIRDDENVPACLRLTSTTGRRIEAKLSQGNVKALRAWLKASLDVQRWY